jgi:hypothetical protein
MEEKVEEERGWHSGRSWAFLEGVHRLQLSQSVAIRLQILQSLRIYLYQQLSRGLLGLLSQSWAVSLVPIVLRLPASELSS